MLRPWSSAVHANIDAVARSSECAHQPALQTADKRRLSALVRFVGFSRIYAGTVGTDLLPFAMRPRQRINRHEVLGVQSPQSGGIGFEMNRSVLSPDLADVFVGVETAWRSSVWRAKL